MLSCGDVKIVGRRIASGTDLFLRFVTICIVLPHKQDAIPVGVSTCRSVDLSACRPVGVSACRCVDLSTCWPVCYA